MYSSTTTFLGKFKQCYRHSAAFTNKFHREWGVVFICALLFFLGAELYKWAKRIFFRRLDAKKGKEDYSADVEERVFQRYMTQSSVASGSGSDREKAGEKV